MKLAKVMLLVLTLLSMTISACASAKHPVGSSIEGTYDFYFDEQLVGYLELSGGHYSLSLLRDNIQFPEGAVVNSEFFVQHPQGLYSIEYYSPVNQDTQLEDLAHYAILLYVRLAVESSSENTNASFVETSFVITKRDHLLELGSTMGQIQGWRVEKPWK